jgi:hypothetical protein
MPRASLWKSESGIRPTGVFLLAFVPARGCSAAISAVHFHVGASAVLSDTEMILPVCEQVLSILALLDEPLTRVASRTEAIDL